MDGAVTTYRNETNALGGVLFCQSSGMRFEIVRLVRPVLCQEQCDFDPLCKAAGISVRRINEITRENSVPVRLLLVP